MKLILILAVVNIVLFAWWHFGTRKHEGGEDDMYRSFTFIVAVIACVVIDFATLMANVALHWLRQR